MTSPGRDPCIVAQTHRRSPSHAAAPTRPIDRALRFLIRLERCGTRRSAAGPVPNPHLDRITALQRANGHCVRVHALLEEAVANPRALWDIENERRARLRKTLTPRKPRVIERKGQNQLSKDGLAGRPPHHNVLVPARAPPDAICSRASGRHRTTAAGRAARTAAHSGAKLQDPANSPRYDLSR
jgi:hypothetical protein